MRQKNEHIKSVSEQPLLVGLLIDVSGSMKTSIKNRAGENLSRLKSLRNSLDELVKKLKQANSKTFHNEDRQVVKVFAYGFGLQIPNKEICDLLTLLKLGSDVYIDEGIQNQGSNTLQNFKDGYARLAQLARTHGYEDGLIVFSRKYLSSSDAGKLAQELEKDRSAAGRLISLIPKTFLDVTTKFVYTKGVNFLTQKETVSDDFTAAEQLSYQLIARADSSSVEAVRDRILQGAKTRIAKQVDLIGDTTLSIKEIADLWEHDQASAGNDDNLDKIEALIYGQTPMRQALEIARKRVFGELGKLPQDAHSLLFVLSDGEPTDGDPLAVASELKDAGVTIISCFVTDKDITVPRVLFNKPNLDWTQGAKLMFNIASVGQENSYSVQFLKERKWSIHPNAKLFVQVNHSEILDEFLQGTLGIVKAIQVTPPS